MFVFFVVFFWGYSLRCCWFVLCYNQMFVHCCVHHIITSDDKIDSWILTSPLDTISEIHLNLLASWYRLVFSVHMSLIGFMLGLWEDYPKTSILAWFRHSFNTCDVVWESLYCWNTQLHPKPSLLLMILGFREKIGDYPPSWNGSLDIPDFKSIMHSFRAMLGSLDFPIAVLMAVSNRS